MIVGSNPGYLLKSLPIPNDFFFNLLSIHYVNCTYVSYFILKCLKFMEDMVSPLETFQSSTIKLKAQV